MLLIDVPTALRLKCSHDTRSECGLVYGAAPTCHRVVAQPYAGTLKSAVLSLGYQTGAVAGTHRLEPCFVRLYMSSVLPCKPARQGQG